VNLITVVFALYFVLLPALAWFEAAYNQAQGGREFVGESPSTWRWPALRQRLRYSCGNGTAAADARRPTRSGQHAGSLGFIGVPVCYFDF
jgi:hypothetical protein